MSGRATAPAPKMKDEPATSPASRRTESGLRPWLQTWKQVLIAEVLRVLGPRQPD